MISEFLIRVSSFVRKEMAEILRQPQLVATLILGAFFRVDEYVTGQLRERKITRLLSAFQADTEFGPAVRAIAKLARAEITDA